MEDSQRVRTGHVAVTTPRPRSALKSFAAVIGAVVSLVYIMNPGLGVLELLPDNLPGIGNLDEAAATGLLIACVRALWPRRSA